MSQQLKLQIMLGAVDKLTAPLKAISRQSTLTAKELAATKKSVRDLEQQSAQIDGYKKLGAQIGATNAQLGEAQTKFDAIKQAIAASANPTRMMVNEYNKAEKALGLLTTKQQAMVQSHREMGQALRATGIDTKALAGHQRQLKTNLAAANDQLKLQRQQLDATAAQQRKLAAAKAGYQQTRKLQGSLAEHGAGGAAAGVAIGLPVYRAVSTYSDFEDAMKGIAKQVEGARGADGNPTALYHQLGREIKDIAERYATQNGAVDIANLVTGGARMGVQGKDNLLAFARTNAMAAKAFELPAEQLAEDMGKIANLYKIPIKDIERLGDAINFLDDNTQSKGAHIIEVMQRMGGVADKLGYQQAAALGSTFLSLGAAPEVAASASNAMVRELSIATMQSKRFASGLKSIGMDAGDVEKRMSTDAMSTILSVLDKLKGLKDEDRLRVTTQLFGKEFGDDAAKLGNNLDELHRQLQLVNDEKARGSMQRESDADNNSLSSQWLLLKAGLDNTSSAMGEQLRAPLMEIIAMLKDVVKGVRAWVEANPELAGTLLKIGAALSAITLAFGGLSLVLSALLGPMAILRLILTTLGVTFGGLLGALSALLWPLTLFIAAGIAIIKFWEPIKAFFSGLFEGILAGLQPVFDAFKPFAPLVDGITSAFGSLLEPLGFTKETLDAVASAGRFVGEMLGWAFNAAMTPLKALLKGLEWVLEAFGVLEKVKGPKVELPSQPGGYTTGNLGGPAAPAPYSYGTPAPLYQPASLKPAASRAVVNQPFYQIDVKAAPGMDESRLAQMMLDKIQEAERGKERKQRASTRDND